MDMDFEVGLDNDDLDDDRLASYIRVHPGLDQLIGSVRSESAIQEIIKTMKGKDEVRPPTRPVVLEYDDQELGGTSVRNKAIAYAVKRGIDEKSIAGVLASMNITSVVKVLGDLLSVLALVTDLGEHDPETVKRLKNKPDIFFTNYFLNVDGAEVLVTPENAYGVLTQMSSVTLPSEKIPGVLKLNINGKIEDVPTDTAAKYYNWVMKRVSELSGVDGGRKCKVFGPYDKELYGLIGMMKSFYGISFLQGKLTHSPRSDSSGKAWARLLDSGGLTKLAGACERLVVKLISMRSYVQFKDMNENDIWWILLHEYRATDLGKKHSDELLVEYRTTVAHACKAALDLANIDGSVAISVKDDVNAKGGSATVQLLKSREKELAPIRADFGDKDASLNGINAAYGIPLISAKDWPATTRCHLIDKCRGLAGDKPNVILIGDGLDKTGVMLHEKGDKVGLVGNYEKTNKSLEVLNKNGLSEVTGDTIFFYDSCAAFDETSIIIGSRALKISEGSAKRWWGGLVDALDNIVAARDRNEFGVAIMKHSICDLGLAKCIEMKVKEKHCSCILLPDPQGTSMVWFWVIVPNQDFAKKNLVSMYSKILADTYRNMEKYRVYAATGQHRLLDEVVYKGPEADLLKSWIVRSKMYNMRLKNARGGTIIAELDNAKLEWSTTDVDMLSSDPNAGVEEGALHSKRKPERPSGEEGGTKKTAVPSTAPVDSMDMQ